MRGGSPGSCQRLPPGESPLDPLLDLSVDRLQQPAKLAQRDARHDVQAKDNDPVSGSEADACS
jgi:hypothetical protein